MFSSLPIPFKATKSLLLPFMGSSVQAGFPSPADDYIDHPIDLNEELISHPAATFFVRVSGDSMVQAGIFSGDMLIVDRAEQAISGKIVVALLNGEFTVKRYIKRGAQFILQAESPSHADIHLTSADEFEVWGVVIHVIHSV